MLNVIFILLFFLSVFTCSREYVDWCVVPTASAVGAFALAVVSIFVMTKRKIVVDVWFVGALICWLVLLCMADGDADSPYVMAAGMIAFFLLARANTDKEWLTDKQAWAILSLLLACEALWGIGQFVRTGNPLKVTGHFDNPVGFALAVVLPIPYLLHTWKNGTGRLKRFAVAVLAVLVVALCLSASRSVIIAACIATIMYRYNEARWARFGGKKRYGCYVLMVAFLVGLCCLKADSANGRLLIWGTALDMMSERPWGYGIGGVAREYMNAQAEFMAGVASPYWQNLTDNVTRVFNEYLALGIELGVWTMLAALGLLLYAVRAILAERDEGRKGVWTLLFLILFVSLFSYPLYYPFVWVVLGYAACRLLPQFERSKCLSPGFLLRFAFLLLFALGILFQREGLRLQREWKDCAQAALAGDCSIVETEYPRLYGHLKDEPMFLYNYGAELYYAADYERSNEVLREYLGKVADYDGWLLVGYNYDKEDLPEKALAAFQKASAMCPGRFYPLYRQMLIFQRMGLVKETRRVAREIVDKVVKVPSREVETMKRKAKDILENEI